MLPLPLPATARLIETDGMTTTDSSSRSSRIESHTGRIRSCSSSNRRLRASSSRSARVAAMSAASVPVSARHALDRPHLRLVDAGDGERPDRAAEALQVELADGLAEGHPSVAENTRCATRICHGAAAAHSRAARFVTLPIAA